MRSTPNGSNTSFLYQKIENFIPSGDKNNVLNIKLKGSARISVIVDVKDLLPDSNAGITSLNNVRLTYKRFKGVKLVNRTNVGDYEEATLPIKSTSFLNNRKQYKVDFQDTFVADNNSDFKFYTDVKVGELTSTGKISGYNLPVKPDHRHTFLLKPMVYGGYLGANKTNFREFMCHNLGATDTNAYANRYAWGRKAVVYKEFGNPHERGDIWREEENPCPVDYRVPTIDEWKLILDERNNARERLYDREGVQTGWKIGGRLALFTTNDYRAWIWTTGIIPVNSRSEYGEDIYTVYIRTYGINSSYQDRRHYGQAVRCIRK